MIDDGIQSYNDFQEQSVTGKVVMLIGSGPRDGVFTFQDKVNI
ncbi:hypothetical protein OKW96_12115 [Sphingobacterium sp. KU25419]|nr:hypothetical protein OKW96_12115 [Sphingobacterium sp. KU25419]